MKHQKYKINTYNRWGYSTGTVYGNNKRKLIELVQNDYMFWLSKRAIEKYSLIVC